MCMSVYANLSLSFMGMCGIFLRSTQMSCKHPDLSLKLMFSEPALTLSSTLTFDPYSLSAVFNNGLQSINNSKLHLERIYLSKLFRNLILFFTVQYKRHFEPRMPQRFLKPDVTITDFLNSVNNVAVSLSSDYLTKCFVEAQICNLGVF